MCALDEVQVTFACTGQTAGTTVTIIIQVRAHPVLVSASAAPQTVESR